VFPEGYPNIDRHYTPKTRPEEMLPFKPGFVAIAVAAEKRLGARVPIVPAGFRYTKARHWRAELHIGEAVYAEDWGSRRWLTERMERRIAELSGLSATKPQPEGGSTPRDSSPADASAAQSIAPIHRA